MASSRNFKMLLSEAKRTGQREPNKPTAIAIHS